MATTKRKPKHAPTYASSLCRDAYGEEVEFNVTIDYTFDPGEREIKWGENATPGCDPLVTIDSVCVTSTGEPLTLTKSEEEQFQFEIIEHLEAQSERDY